MSQALSSETGIPVVRLLRLEETDDGQLIVLVCRKRLPNSEDTKELLTRVYGDVPQIMLRLLQRKNTPRPLADKALRAFVL